GAAPASPAAPAGAAAAAGPPRDPSPRGEDGSWGELGVLYDATLDPAAGEALLDLIRGQRALDGRQGRLFGRSGSRLPELVDDAAPDELRASPLGVEQSNTSIAFGDRVILKVLRAVEDGVSPDLEVSRHLTERRRFPHS